MSEKDPGIIFDASNSWNGYNHQGKVALFVAIKTICELWDKTLSEAENKKNLEQYFLEVEYYEDFSIGKYLDNGDVQYISVHQVKDKENANLNSYDSALLGLIQHFIDRNSIENAYLHVTTNLEISQKELSEYISKLVKTPRFIEEQLSIIEKKCGDANFRAELVKKKQGRRSELKQNLLAVLENNGATKIELNESNLDEAFELYKALLNERKNEIASIDKKSIDKIGIFNYPIASGQSFCAVNEIRDILKTTIKSYYNTNQKYTDVGSFKCVNDSFNGKCYCFITDKLNEHVVDRDLNYHDYKCGRKNRKIPFNEIIEWLDSDEIDSFDEDYYLYYVRENMFDFMDEYCGRCKSKSKCENICRVEEFKDKLAKMNYDQLREFVYHSNPQVSQSLDMRHYARFVPEDVIGGHFSDGLKNINKDFLSKKSAVTYLDNESSECILTTIRSGALDEESICSEILKNRNIYEMMMDCDFLISKDIDVDSIESKSVTPIGTENAKNSAHIARCKDVQIINLKRFKDKIKGAE